MYKFNLDRTRIVNINIYVKLTKECRTRLITQYVQYMEMDFAMGTTSSQRGIRLTYYVTESSQESYYTDMELY